MANKTRILRIFVDKENPCVITEDNLTEMIGAEIADEVELLWDVYYDGNADNFDELTEEEKQFIYNTISANYISRHFSIYDIDLKTGAVEYVA